MKNRVTVIAGCICTILFAGCASDEYTIEKKFYTIQKQAAAIFKNPEASPPAELERVVGLFNDFANEYRESNMSLEAQFNIARLYIVKREYEKGRAQLNSMLQRYRDSVAVCSEIIFLAGNSYELQDKWLPAKAEYEKIIREYPLTLRGFSTPLYIAQHHKIKYEPEQMLEAYKDAARHYRALAEKYPDPRNGFTAYSLLAQCYIEIKDWRSVINTYNTILQKYKEQPNLDAIMMSMALIYKGQLEDDARAKETLERLVKDYPKSKFQDAAKDFLKKMENK